MCTAFGEKELKHTHTHTWTHTQLIWELLFDTKPLMNVLVFFTLLTCFFSSIPHLGEKPSWNVTHFFPIMQPRQECWTCSRFQALTSSLSRKNVMPIILAPELLSGPPSCPLPSLWLFLVVSALPGWSIEPRVTTLLSEFSPKLNIIYTWHLVTSKKTLKSFPCVKPLNSVLTAYRHTRPPRMVP